jgi:hypothetical protein
MINDCVPNYPTQVRFINAALLSQLCKGNVSFEGHLAGNVIFVNRLYGCCIVLLCWIRICQSIQGSVLSDGAMIGKWFALTQGRRHI